MLSTMQSVKDVSEHQRLICSQPLKQIGTCSLYTEQSVEDISM